jgi:hypothetical protein
MSVLSYHADLLVTSCFVPATRTYRTLFARILASTYNNLSSVVVLTVFFSTSSTYRVSYCILALVLPVLIFISRLSLHYIFTDTSRGKNKQTTATKVQ